MADGKRLKSRKCQFLMCLIKIIGCIHCCIGWKPAGNKPYKSYENLYSNKRLCNCNRVFFLKRFVSTGQR